MWAEERPRLFTPVHLNVLQRQERSLQVHLEVLLEALKVWQKDMQLLLCYENKKTRMEFIITLSTCRRPAEKRRIEFSVTSLQRFEERNLLEIFRGSQKLIDEVKFSKSRIDRKDSKYVQVKTSFPTKKRWTQFCIVDHWATFLVCLHSEFLNAYYIQSPWET